ncbi:Y-family DNA polymerase [Candidatus Woesebacteria bacterium]|nr:Y-family DNA polymerase [Candidatus Woesebacteria bacterium]
MKDVQTFFLLVDCNNFYVSCERVFNPSLEDMPVIVLSNNDGCVISRSDEVKVLGIPMAAPIFQYKNEIKLHNIKLFSANFPLYGDMSRRVMSIVARHAPKMEVYSIDEVFVHIKGISHDRVQYFAKKLRHRIKKEVGIPVSIGIGTTKTLAKAANYLAKRTVSSHGVFLLCSCGQTDICSHAQIDNHLQQMDVGSVWGIGRKTRAFLHNHGIYNASQLKHLDHAWTKRELHKPGLETVLELQGVVVKKLENLHKSKKSIICSRSFSKPVTTLEHLSEAVTEFVARAAEKLREEHELTSIITIYIATNRHRKHDKQYTQSLSIPMPAPTADTATLIKTAQNILTKIYKQGYRYKKALAMLSGLMRDDSLQDNLFGSSFTPQRKQLMATLDTINTTWGSNTLMFASQGIAKPWRMKRAMRSPRYTTKWDELVFVH